MPGLKPDSASASSIELKTDIGLKSIKTVQSRTEQGLSQISH